MRLPNQPILTQSAERDKAQGQVPLPSVDQPKDRTDQGLPLPRFVLRFRGSGNRMASFFFLVRMRYTIA
jgi:hypothetical protein